MMLPAFFARRALLPLLLLGASVLAPPPCAARPAASAPRTGLETPDAPRRPVDAPAGQATARSSGASGMKGHLDAYGRPVVPMKPEEKKERKRLPAGAYGGYGQHADVPPLPDVTPRAPAWKF